MEPRDHLFTIWLTDNDWDAMPFLDEICIASAQVANNKPITIYTNHKLHLSFLDRTITKVEMIDEHLLKIAEEISDNKAHQSDYIRLRLLAEKGGIYFDTDILFWDSFKNIWDELHNSNYNVLYPREDKNMICNCVIMCDNTFEAKPFFDNIINTYETRFIRHSYLFNSQKYINFMYRKYPYILNIYEKPSVFPIPWNDNTGAFFKNDKLEGIGQHLYSSVPEWKNIRLILDKCCYDDVDKMCWFPIQVTTKVINKYIDLMKEADNNGK